MSKFDPKIHHRRSIRLKEYDYSQAGAYFITIVTWQRECLFGEIVNGEMILSSFGMIASQQWEKLPKRFKNIELGAYMIMPNHMHGIILISEGRGTAENPKDLDVKSTRRALTRDGDGRGTAENPKNLDAELTRRAPTREQFQKPVRGSIPTIIRSYKSAVSYRINLMRRSDGLPVWQRNYYEHVIRNEKDLQNKTEYIQANPLLWEQDEENPSHIKG
jgi:putative transposase